MVMSTEIGSTVRSIKEERTPDEEEINETVRSDDLQDANTDSATTAQPLNTKEHPQKAKRKRESFVHGHIHNYNQLTYIHGHVHNSRKKQAAENAVQSTGGGGGEGMTTDSLNHGSNDNKYHSLPMEKVGSKDLLGNATGSVDINSSCLEYDDCQHFEFINYHNLDMFHHAGDTENVLRDMGNTTEKRPLLDDNTASLSNKRNKRNSINCKDTECLPKIVEICCDNDHNSAIKNSGGTTSSAKNPQDIPTGGTGGSTTTATPLNDFANCCGTDTAKGMHPDARKMNKSHSCSHDKQEQDKCHAASEYDNITNILFLDPNTTIQHLFPENSSASTGSASTQNDTPTHNENSKKNQNIGSTEDQHVVSKQDQNAGDNGNQNIQLLFPPEEEVPSCNLTCDDHLDTTDKLDTQQRLEHSKILDTQILNDFINISSMYDFPFANSKHDHEHANKVTSDLHKDCQQHHHHQQQQHTHNLLNSTISRGQSPATASNNSTYGASITSSFNSDTRPLSTEQNMDLQELLHENHAQAHTSQEHSHNHNHHHHRLEIHGHHAPLNPALQPIGNPNFHPATGIAQPFPTHQDQFDNGVQPMNNTQTPSHYHYHPQTHMAGQNLVSNCHGLHGHGNDSNVETNQINFHWTNQTFGTPSSTASEAQTDILCKWDGCGKQFASLIALQAHILKEHVGSHCFDSPLNGNGQVNPEQQTVMAPPTSADGNFGFPPHSNSSSVAADFQNKQTPTLLNNDLTRDTLTNYGKESHNICSWMDCFYESSNIYDLVNHVNTEHGIGFQMDVGNSNISMPHGTHSTPHQTLHSHYAPLNNNHIPGHEHEHTHNSTVSGNGSVPSSVKSDSRLSIDGPRSISAEPFQDPDHHCTTECHSCKWKDCGMVFSSCKELDAHLEQAHLEKGKSFYQCEWDQCGKQFKQRQKLQRHLKVHSCYKGYQCNICKKFFSTLDILSQHTKIHDPEKVKLQNVVRVKSPCCKKCDIEFEKDEDLKQHSQLHKNARTFTCGKCGRVFKEQSNYSKHLKTHNYKFKCSFCPKSFTKQDSLERHLAKFHSR